MPADDSDQETQVAAPEIARHRGPGRAGLPAYAGFALLGLLAVMGYSLRDVGREKLMDLLEGLGFAMMILGLVVFCLVRIIRFLEADARRNGSDGETEAGSRRIE